MSEIPKYTQQMQTASRPKAVKTIPTATKTIPTATATKTIPTDPTTSETDTTPHPFTKKNEREISSDSSDSESDDDSTIKPSQPITQEKKNDGKKNDRKKNDGKKEEKKEEKKNNDNTPTEIKSDQHPINSKKRKTDEPTSTDTTEDGATRKKPKRSNVPSWKKDDPVKRTEKIIKMIFEHPPMKPINKIEDVDHKLMITQSQQANNQRLLYKIVKMLTHSKSGKTFRKFEDEFKQFHGVEFKRGDRF